MKTSTIRKFGALFLALSLTALSACSGAKNPAGSKAPGATPGQTPARTPGQTQSGGKTLRVARRPPPAAWGIAPSTTLRGRASSAPNGSWAWRLR